MVERKPLLIARLHRGAGVNCGPTRSFFLGARYAGGRNILNSSDEFKPSSLLRATNQLIARIHDMSRRVNSSARARLIPGAAILSSSEPMRVCAASCL